MSESVGNEVGLPGEDDSETLSPERIDKLGNQIARRVALTYSGPLPPPASLERYEAICPGAADRIITMAEENAVHRRGIESRVVEGNVVAQARGQHYAFIISLVVTIGSVWMILTDKEAFGFSLILAELGVLAGVFITGKLKQQSDLAKKREELGRPPTPRKDDES